MKAAVMTSPQVTVIEDRPVPELGAKDVLVRIEAVGVCGSDVHFYKAGRVGDVIVEKPMILGHEPAGVVADVGPDVDRSLVGRRVSIEPGVPCFTCGECLEGRYNLCPNVVFYATPPIDGAFAEYAVTHEAFVFPLPDSMSFVDGALLEPLSVAIHAARIARIQPGDRVLVTGAGPVGILSAQVARAFGASEVLLADLLQHRLDFAKDMTGISGTRDQSSWASFEPTVLMECTGGAEPTYVALEALARAGRAALIGMGPTSIEIPVNQLQNREVEILGISRYRNTWPLAIQMVESGQVVLDGLASHHYDLEQVHDALMASTNEPDLIKAFVYPNGRSEK